MIGSMAQQQASAMNGAESLVHTLVGSGIDTCFANPGTSEMHFVSALDRIAGMRSILCLFEGAVTGAADGYGRMTERPAATLLHLGPGLAYGAPNLHNARRARTPVVNIVGDQAHGHRKLDAPLTSDIEALAGTVSHWFHTSENSKMVGRDAAKAVSIARERPGNIATLILPADVAWGPAETIAPPIKPRERAKASDTALESAAKRIRKGGKILLLLGDDALSPEARRHAAKLSSAFGVELLAPAGNRRIDRGQGTVAVERIPFAVDQAVARLKSYDAAILVGCDAPVAFFAYPNKPGKLLPRHCEVVPLATIEEDSPDALRRLAENLCPNHRPSIPSTGRAPSLPSSDTLTKDSVGAIVGALLPEGAIVCDESVTTGRKFFDYTEHSPPHSWLQITGGAIGLGIPMATGAAVGCSDRKVITLVGDGSALYTVQALWTQARERLDVLTLVFANRSYAILKGELTNVGAQTGPVAQSMLTLEDPSVDWVALANGLGVEAGRAQNTAELVKLVKAALTRPGPFLIEVVLPEV